MEIGVAGIDFPEPTLPRGYVWLAWESGLLERHALVKQRSFCDELDSQVFPCLGEVSGCRRLMSEISGQEAFLPEATWLIAWTLGSCGEPTDCGTIQGVRPQSTTGAVQNVGVIPEHRGAGLGRCLMLKALAGFRDAGVRRVYLDVTASNLAAINLYRSLGFRLTRTTYKPLGADAAATRSY
jgi:ribosomal protein S18 acetylase RimI-like enzyme